jgi:hypothetical protein
MVSDTLTIVEKSQDKVEFTARSGQHGGTELLIDNHIMFLTDEQAVELGTWLVNHFYSQTIRNIRDRRDA